VNSAFGLVQHQKVLNTVCAYSHEHWPQCDTTDTILQVQTAADSGKHDDTGAIKHGLIKLIPHKCLPDTGEEDNPNTVQSYLRGILAPDLSKAWRGFNNTLTATLLCPVDHLAMMKANPDESVDVHLPRMFTDCMRSLGRE